MKSKNKDEMYFLGWVFTAIFFGLWQWNFFAGAFMICLPFIVEFIIKNRDK